MNTEFKPFDKVLVRDDDTKNWFATLFSRYSNNTNYPYLTVDCIEYKYCIPFEGNEHLNGTNNNYKEREKEIFKFGDKVKVWNTGYLNPKKGIFIKYSNNNTNYPYIVAIEDDSDRYFSNCVKDEYDK